MPQLLETTALVIIFTLIAGMFTLITLLEYFAWKHRKTSSDINDILEKLPKYLPIGYGNEKPHRIGCINIIANGLLALVSLIVWGFLIIDMVFAILVTQGIEQLEYLVLTLLSVLVICLSFYFPLHHTRRIRRASMMMSK